MKKRYFAGAAVAAMILTAGMAMTSFADWSQQNGKWYYYNDNNGRLVRNDWVCSKDAWYYMDYNGVMQTNSLIDDTYYVSTTAAGTKADGDISEQTERRTQTAGNRSMTCGTTLRIPLWISAGWRSMVRSII